MTQEFKCRWVYFISMKYDQNTEIYSVKYVCPDAYSVKTGSIPWHKMEVERMKFTPCNRAQIEQRWDEDKQEWSFNI